jgi:hypothetical protein
MAQQDWEFATELESRLHEGLPALHAIACEIGAASVSVWLVKNRRSIQVVHVWPNPGNPYTEVLQLEGALADALGDAAGYVPESSPIAQYLHSKFPAGGASFFLYSWGTERFHTVVAFGFTARSPPEPVRMSGIPSIVKLTAVATWSVYECCRLHSELAIVNERLGKSKLIERAKGQLQMEHGLSEQQAYEHLRRLSRQRRMRISDIAKDLLDTASARPR